ncbi:alpha/beta-hydrolase [Auriscalpium vulgare]|uniref:Alpha/beta-hydrolase n=1 Tax=Auriscalpium vulgare TaxID=40419 RepID=A0ACB8RMI7_9AGAM|nr:alpha/beta-hydrolase [Auriscalpium vulgare]
MSTPQRTILATGPGECCLKTVQHIGDPKGTQEELAGIQTYTSYPPSKHERYEHIVLFYTDVWGPFYINNKLIADFFASRGYLVVSPDSFEGDTADLHIGKPDFNMMEWGTAKRSRANELVPQWIDAVKSRYGSPTTKYVAVGYCFGGPDALDSAGADWITAAAFAHPAFLTEEQFLSVKKPLFLSCAETDWTFERSARHRAEEILTQIKAEYHIQVFSGVAHGFAVRGNPDVPHERWAKETSASSIIAWFDRFCK